MILQGVGKLQYFNSSPKGLKIFKSELKVEKGPPDPHTRLPLLSHSPLLDTLAAVAPTEAVGLKSSFREKKQRKQLPGHKKERNTLIRINV